MKRVCVFAASRSGMDPVYIKAAQRLGEELAKERLELVYGGAKVGLMGTVADTVLQHSGVAIGVIPKGLFDKEIPHTTLTQLYEVNSMHERKAKMSELADAFIALPGGYGTWEELFEVVCWQQIGIHQKPIGLLNVEGYYDPLFHLIQKAVDAGFIPKTHQQVIICEESPVELIQKLRNSV